MQKAEVMWVFALMMLSSVLVFEVDGTRAAGLMPETSIEERGAPRAVTLIYNVYDLQNMSKDLNGNYALANDINASETSSWNGGKGFAPVGSEDSSFNGTLDGNGYGIFNLYIDRSNEDNIGLFGYTDSRARICELNLLINKVRGNIATAGLSGYSKGTISNCTSAGPVIGCSYTGGLVGIGD